MVHSKPASKLNSLLGRVIYACRKELQRASCAPPETLQQADSKWNRRWRTKAGSRPLASANRAPQSWSATSNAAHSLPPARSSRRRPRLDVRISLDSAQLASTLPQTPHTCPSLSPTPPSRQPPMTGYEHGAKRDRGVRRRTSGAEPLCRLSRGRWTNVISVKLATSVLAGSYGDRNRAGVQRKAACGNTTARRE